MSFTSVSKTPSAICHRAFIAAVIACPSFGCTPPQKPKPQVVLANAEAGLTSCEVQEPTIAVDKQYVWFQGEVVRPVALLAEGADVQRFEPLIERLETFEREWEAARPGHDLLKSAVLELDTSTDVRVVRKVFMSMRQAGFMHACIAIQVDQAKAYLPIEDLPPASEDVDHADMSSEPFIMVRRGGFDVRPRSTVWHGSFVAGDPQQLRQKLAKWRLEHAGNDSISVTCDDGVTHVQLAAAMGAALAAGFSRIAFSTFR